VHAFKHVLIQEAALSTLTPARRKELNRRVTAAFEEVYGDSLDHHVERLAYYNATAATSREHSSA
jgi:hypothetical protein